MFKTQIQELKSLEERLVDEISDMEASIKSKKEELRDVKQGLASLERIQSKYEPKEVENEASNIYI